MLTFFADKPNSITYMKSKFIAGVLIFVIFSGFSFQKFPNSKFRPPGTVKIVENFFMDEGELTNMDWREYLYWLKKEHGVGSQVYISAIPDTTVWFDYHDHQYGDPFGTLASAYFNHPAFNEYPIVGISHDQAVKYCQWRTDRVKEMLSLRPDGDEFPNFEYRLPTKTEWELVANTGYKELSKKLKRQIKKDPEKILYNLKREFKDENSTTHFTAPSRSYLPNKHGIYHLFGNVAEMVAEKGIAKGGSWENDYDEVMSGKDFTYDKPMSWLGFRCVCVILE